MKKSLLFYVLILFVLTSLMCACESGGNGEITTADPTSTTAAPAPDTSAAEPETTAAVQTEAVTTLPETTVPAPAAPVIVEVKWNCGYVGSDQNAQNYVNKIKENGGSYSYSDVITISKAGTKIYFTDDNTNSNGDVNFASAAAYVISSWKWGDNDWVIDLDGANYRGCGNAASDISVANADGSVTYVYTTSKDNENIRLCFRSGQKSSFTPAKFPNVYAEFTGEAGTISVSNREQEAFDAYIADAKANIKYPNLKGLTINFIGDSYFAGNGLDPNHVWPSLITTIYDMKGTNYGKNGSTVSNYVTDKNPMCVRYKTMASNDPDIVIFEGGRNDYNKLVPIGTNDSTDTKTFKGALNVLIDGLIKKYPNAVIMGVTPWKVSGTNNIGNTVGDYADAMREICALKGVPCFSADDPALSGVDMTDAGFRAKYSMKPTDVSHLNLEGHKLVLPAFEKFISETYASAKK